MILAFIGAAFPQASVLAADSNCQDTYTVKSGDYLIKIANQYSGINYLDIADANSIESPYVVVPGQKLCIPYKSSTGTSTGTGTSVSTPGNITVTRRGDKLTVSAVNLQKSATYFVKADDANKAGYGWFRLGVFHTDSNREGDGTYILPSELENATAFIICLKNVTTDDLICTDSSLTHVETGTGGTGGTTTKASFTITRLTAGRFMVSTSSFSKDSFWKVRVREWGGNLQDWADLGILRTEGDTSGHYIYDIPNRFLNKDLYVCLKNQVTDEVICVINNS
jgi:hypothetical protein